MRQRVARSRELVAAGERPAVVARVAKITRQALYRTPKPRAAPQRRPAVEGSVEQAIVETAKENPTDGYRMVWALTRRKLGVAINRKRVLRVMRQHGLIQRRRSVPRRRRPGFFRVTRPAELWHMDMTSIWVAEHGWCYLNAIIDCCTREIVGWGLEVRCRALEAIAIVEQAVPSRASHPGRSRSAPTTARRSPPAGSGRCSPAWAFDTAGAATATPSRKRSSRAGSQSSRSAASGATSSRPLDQAREVIAAHIDRYHDRPHQGLGYRTPREVRQTWDDAQEPLQKRPPEVSTAAGSRPVVDDHRTSLDVWAHYWATRSLRHYRSSSRRARLCRPFAKRARQDSNL